ncbi:MAG: hypothetical protein U9N32_04770, partial [Spirochaetota bacterium]|nr:hypothetical protein [Spirochaetota bacterium]
ILGITANEIAISFKENINVPSSKFKVPEGISIENNYAAEEMYNQIMTDDDSEEKVEYVEEDEESESHSNVELKYSFEKFKRNMNKTDFPGFKLSQCEKTDDGYKAVFMKYGNSENYLFLWNKIDTSGLIMPEGNLPVSAVTGEGLSNLEDAIAASLTGIHVSGTELMIDSLRQKDLLLRAKESLEVVRVSLDNNISLDAVAIDLKDSLDAIGEITGEVSSVDILNNIFSGFCVGK